MPLPTVREALTYDEYEDEVKKFQARMQKFGDAARATFSEERAKNDDRARRFVAYADDGSTVAGWMVLKVQAEDVKIDGICVDSDKTIKQGVAKLLITRAVNISFQLGKGGVVTLTNTSRGTGDSLYSYMGFVPTDADGHMRLNISGNPNWSWQQGPVLSKTGKEMQWTELARRPG